jgi:calcium-translocating P-type ATPase
MAPAAAGVVTGSAEAVIWATGPASTLGRIATLVAGMRRGTSVLEEQVSALSRLTAVLAVLAGTATLLIATASTDVDFLSALTFATGVIVALVPEGLLPTLSVSLAIGARRMASRGAAIRRLSAVEAVGAVTVICTDKTGTLTQNTLSVLGFTGFDGATPPGSDGLRAAAICNDARWTGDDFSGDAIDVALARWVTAHGIDLAATRARYPRIDSVPFDANRRYMSTTCIVDGAPHDFIKGAPESVLALCDGETRPQIDSALRQAAERGERVIMLAQRLADQRTQLIGLVRLHDPPRPEVPAAIAACGRARLRVVMLTGDHPATARAVAQAVGLHVSGDVCTGTDMEALSNAQLLAMMKHDAIFARINPAQKLRIIELLARAGGVVIATGDGINDAPALRGADVGVAMGRRGSEVAKQAADIVLSDDNFATIVSAIEEGRSIKANIRRFASYVFTSNVAELAPFLVYVFLPVPLPLMVAQVLAVDLGTDLLPAMALGAEPPGPHTMDAPPEPRDRPLLTRTLGTKTFLFFGMIEALLGLGCFFAMYAWHGWRPFEGLGGYQGYLGQARTMTFLGIVSGQVGCLFAARDGGLARRLALTGNAWIPAGLTFELVLAVALVYVPGVNALFSMEAVPPAWLAVVPAGAALFITLDQVRRYLARALVRH